MTPVEIGNHGKSDFGHFKKVFQKTKNAENSQFFLRIF